MSFIFCRTFREVLGFPVPAAFLRLAQNSPLYVRTRACAHVRMRAHVRSMRAGLLCLRCRRAAVFAVPVSPTRVRLLACSLALPPSLRGHYRSRRFQRQARGCSACPALLLWQRGCG